jgi:hypothetical protein
MAPVAVCKDDQILEAGPGCEAEVSIDDGCYDPDGDVFIVYTSPPPPYPLGTTEVTVTVEDWPWQETDSCTATVTVLDTTPPEVLCNSPATIIPPDAPITFTAGVADNCDAIVEIVSYDCWATNGAGKIISKLESCVVSTDGNVITIDDSGGVGDHIDWVVKAEDSSGNVSYQTCSIEVTNPTKG